MVDQGLKLRDGDALINAEFTLSVLDSRHFELTLESSGGAADGPEFRNREYTRGLREILARLSTLGVLLDDCQVMSTRTRTLPEVERRVVPTAPFSYPIHLTASMDFESLRKALTRPQPSIASRAKQGSGGNNTKRITMWFSSRQDGVSRESLVTALSAVPSGGPRSRRSDIALGVTREAVVSALAEFRKLGPDAFHDKFGTERAARFVIAEPDGTEFDAKAVLYAARKLSGLDGLNSDFRGNARTVQEPLQRLGFIVECSSSGEDGETDTSDVTGLVSSEVAIAAARDFLGATDGRAQVLVRREQRILRRALGLTGESGSCAICGNTYPSRLLVAAHIRRRSDCTEEERRDIPAIAMIACTLGCDALFEHGYLVIGADGRVEATSKALAKPALSEVVASRVGNLVAEPGHPSRGYFEAHRQKWNC